MIRTVSFVALATCIALSFGAERATAKEFKVISQKTVGGFGHIESVAYDRKEKVFYTSEFGAGDLKPAEKDGKGKILKVSLDGQISDSGIAPPAGETFHKPKGIWIRGNRMWFTDIDVVWEFDLKSKKGKKLALPVTFANDPAVIKNVLYISDNRGDKLVKVEPANFLTSKKEPKITTVFEGKGIGPNGIYPAKNGSLLIVGFQGKDKPQGIYELPLGQEPKLLSDKIGMLDGLYQARNGDIVSTDWVTGSLFQWNEKMGKKELAADFKGPADFAVVRNREGYLVAVPDLVKGEMRLIQLGR